NRLPARIGNGARENKKTKLYLDVRRVCSCFVHASVLGYTRKVNAMHERFDFDREKFKDVVHYVVHHVNATDGRDALGNTKLHKVLYYADVLHFLDKGKPLTGADYLRQRFGPIARHLSSALGDLEREKRVCVSHRNYYGYSKCEYDSLKEFKSNR